MPSLPQEHVVREIEASFRRGREPKDFRLGLRVAPLPNAATLDDASSARWFAGWRREVAVDRSPPLSLGAEPAVAEPRTWFLRRGWRLHGLIDPNEIPGALEV
jgi:hypothetical protein